MSLPMQPRTLTETMEIFEMHEVRLLTRDEVRTVMPQYPLPPA
jgi:hypothetical protein